MIDYPNRQKYIDALQKQLEPNVFKHSLVNLNQLIRKKLWKH